MKCCEYKPGVKENKACKLCAKVDRLGEFFLIGPEEQGEYLCSGQNIPRDQIIDEPCTAADAKTCPVYMDYLATGEKKGEIQP